MEVTYARSSSQERGELKTLTHQEQIHQVGWKGEGLVPGTTRLQAQCPKHSATLPT